MAPTRRVSSDFSPRSARSPREHREFRTPRDAREIRTRRSAPAVGSADGETRRIKKEIRLERRLRRRAEDSATAIWRNALFIAGAVSLCVGGIVALSVALAVRR